MQVKQRPFGRTPDGAEAFSYTVGNANGMRVTLLSYGAAVQSIQIPDGGGHADVALGYDDLSGYLSDTCCFGATVGRVANRIKGGAFELGGVSYRVAKNDGENHLHGGPTGFNKRNWSGTILPNGVAFTRYSPDGEEGYPGGLLAAVRYLLDEDNALHIAYTACAEADTPVNLTNHSYFNLAGHGDILGQELRLDADFYTPNDAGCVPTGEILSVKGTPMDFTAPKPIGRDIGADFTQVRQFGGYDHNFALRGAPGLREIASARDPESGRALYVYTDLPGVQLYTGNMTDAIGKGGVRYQAHAGFCLETQYFPDAVHHRHFEGPILKAGEPFRSETVYRFTW